MAPKQRNTAPSAAPPSAFSHQHTTTSAASSHSVTTASFTSSNSTTTATTSIPASTPTTSSSTAASSSASKQSLNAKDAYDLQSVIQVVWDNYVKKTPQRVKLLDVFMAFLVVVGAVQFVYCVVAGNFPFNAFLSGFSATVGQFVLTASLRIQTNPENKVEFKEVSHERAFADYVFGSLILHFFCINFIN